MHVPGFNVNCEEHDSPAFRPSVGKFRIFLFKTFFLKQENIFLESACNKNVIAIIMIADLRSLIIDLESVLVNIINGMCGMTTVVILKNRLNYIAR